MMDMVRAPVPGVERWEVKIGTDDAAPTRSGVASPVQTTIAEMRAFAPPNPWLPNTPRLTPVEITYYAIACTLIGFKHEADGDYHLVLSDQQNQTMIAEIPDPSLVPDTSPFASEIVIARQMFDAQIRLMGLGPFNHPIDRLNPLHPAYLGTIDALGIRPQLTMLDIPVHIAGVGFFDKLHGQDGVAPNGIELHPVLSIAFPEGG